MATLLGHGSVMLLSLLPGQLLDSLVPLLCFLSGVLYSGRLKPQWADGWPPRV